MCSSADLGAGALKPHRHRKGKRLFLRWGRCPHGPWDLSLSARMAAERGGLRRPPFRTWIGALVASPRCQILRPSLASISPPQAGLRKNVCRNGHRRVINTLVLVQFRRPVLKWPRMAGFQVAAEDQWGTMVEFSTRSRQPSSDCVPSRIDQKCAFWSVGVQRFG
jgi:hypothetical protein